MSNPNYSLIWNWWSNASLKNKQHLMAQLVQNNWLRSLPASEQFLLFEYAPQEIKEYLPKWKEIHPHALKLLGLSIYSKGIESLLIPLKRR